MRGTGGYLGPGGGGGGTPEEAVTAIDQRNAEMTFAKASATAPGTLR